MTYPTSPAESDAIGSRRRGHDADLLGVELGALGHRAQRLSRREAAVHDADECDDAAVLVVRRIEHERARRRVRVAGRRGDPLDDGVEHLRDAGAGLRGDAQHALGRLADELAQLLRGAVGIGLWEVDLVRSRNDLETAVDGEVRVRERLRLDPLRRVDDEQRALARLERARDLVREVDVPGRVDEVELMAAPVHAHGLCLDRDPPLALEVHRVEELLAHLSGRDGAGQLEDAVGERRLPVVDVRDDREVANAVLLHRDQRSYEGSSRRARNSSNASSSRSPSARASAT